MSTNIDKLHDRARRAIESGEAKYRDAGKYLTEAQKLGATTRQSAKAVGKSASWVSALLRWSKSGKGSCPFPRATRRVQPAAQARRRPPTTDLQIARANAQTARAAVVAQMFAPEPAKIPAGPRGALVRALQALGSGHPAERARARLGLSWDALLIPAMSGEIEVSDAA